MSRWLPFLAELQPELFVEVSPELAAARGLEHNGWCHVITSRTAVQAKVVVTQRIRPLRVQGQTVHQVWMPYHFGPGGLATGDVMNDLLGIVADPNVHIQEGKVATCDVRPGPRPTRPALTAYVEDYRRRAGISAGVRAREQQPVRPARRRRGRRRPRRPPAAHGVLHRHVGLHRCKACEVACKQWNGVPAGDELDLLGMSHDNTGELGANSWRHVAFIEQASDVPSTPADLGMPGGPYRAPQAPRPAPTSPADVVGRLQALHARRLPGRLPDEGAVPHRVRLRGGAAGHLQRLRLRLFSGCPYGVIERRPDDGRAQKCTLCYDRLHDGLEPACAKACPTDSIQFGELDELREQAATRVATLHERGDQRPAVRARSGRRRRRQRCVLPAAGRARGVRPAAGPGRAHGTWRGCGASSARRWGS